MSYSNKYICSKDRSRRCGNRHDLRCLFKSPPFLEDTDSSFTWTYAQTDLTFLCTWYEFTRTYLAVSQKI